MNTSVRKSVPLHDLVETLGAAYSLSPSVEIGSNIIYIILHYMEGPNPPSPEVIYTMPVFIDILHDIFNVSRSDATSNTNTSDATSNTNPSNATSNRYNLIYNMNIKACFISIYSYTLKNPTLLNEYYVSPDVVSGFLNQDLISSSSTKRNLLSIIQAYSLNATLSLHMINADNDLFYILSLYLKACRRNSQSESNHAAAFIASGTTTSTT